MKIGKTSFNSIIVVTMFSGFFLACSMAHANSNTEFVDSLAEKVRRQSGFIALQEWRHCNYLKTLKEERKLLQENKKNMYEKLLRIFQEFERNNPSIKCKELVS